MRLFTGVGLPETVSGMLAALAERLRPHAAIRWSAEANLHITTKFIGEWPENRLTELVSALRETEWGTGFVVHLESLGWFPNPHQPRIFLVRARPEEPMAELAARTNRSLAALGIEPEARPYHPHITLARIPPRRPAVDLAPLRRAVAGIEAPELGRFDCSSFHLYESRQEKGGSVYTKLASFPLQQLP